MTKKKLIIWAVAIVTLMLTTVIGWEQIDGPLADWYDGEEVVFERMRPEPSEYELWLKRVEVQEQLTVMFERYQLNEKDAELKAQQVELEKKKEELRAKELEVGSLQ